MLDVHIGRRRRQAAQTWNELTGAQLLQVSRIHATTYAGNDHLDRALLGVLLQVPARVLDQINAVQVVNLKEHVAFLKEPGQGRPLTAQLLFRLPVGSWGQVVAALQYRPGTLYGPRESFVNLTFSEFIFADTFFLRYIQTNEATWLDQLVAVLYRPQRAGYNPTAVGYGGDRREDFNEHLVPARAKYMARVPHFVKLAVLLYYRGCRRELERRYARVFEGDTEQKAAISGWQAVLLNLADGVHRIDATAGQKLHNVMREMQRVLENYDRAKEAQTS